MTYRTLAAAAAMALAAAGTASAQTVPVGAAGVVHGVAATPTGLTAFERVGNHLVATANDVSEIIDHGALSSGASEATGEYIVGGHTFAVTRIGGCVFEATLEGEATPTMVTGLKCPDPVVTIVNAMGLGGTPSAMLYESGVGAVALNGFCVGTMFQSDNAGLKVSRALSVATVNLPSGQVVEVEGVCTSPSAAPAPAADGDGEALQLTVDGGYHPAIDYVNQVCSSLRHDDAFSADDCIALAAAVGEPAGLVTGEALRAPRGYRFVGRDKATVKAILARHDGQVTGWTMDAGNVRYIILWGACTEVCDGSLAIYHLHKERVVVVKAPPPSDTKRCPETCVSEQRTERVDGQKAGAECFVTVAGEKRPCD